MKIVKGTLFAALLALVSIGAVKFAYRDTAEQRGFDFSAPIQWNKDYFLLRLFTPATTTGVQDEIRKKRTSLLANLNHELLPQTPDIQKIAKIKEELIENDKRWDENVYFVERQGQAAYYKTVTAPRLQPLKIAADAFIVTPYFIYGDAHSRLMRWVIDPQFSTDIHLSGPAGKELRFRAIHSDSVYNELVLDHLDYGSWTWEARAKSPQGMLQSKGHFEMRAPTRLAFYSDTQDSLDYHRRAVEFIQKLNAAQPIDVVLHGGDMTSFGSNESEMVESAQVFSSLGIPGIFCIGNHDYAEDYGYTTDAPYFKQLFSITAKAAADFKVFTLGDERPVRLMVLDTNFPRIPASSFLEQDRTIRKTLQDSLPVIIAGHHGYFTKGWHGSFLGSHSETWIESLYLKLLQNAAVPLTLTGHEHVYQRIVDENSKSRTEHIVAGTASAKILYPYFQSPGKVMSLERRRTVTLIEIKTKTLEVCTYDFETGEAIDRTSVPY